MLTIVAGMQQHCRLVLTGRENAELLQSAGETTPLNTGVTDQVCVIVARPVVLLLACFGASHRSNRRIICRKGGSSCPSGTCSTESLTARVVTAVRRVPQTKYSPRWEA